jgi:hypothetical protein
MMSNGLWLLITEYWISVVRDKLGPGEAARLAKALNPEPDLYTPDTRQPLPPGFQGDDQLGFDRGRLLEYGSPEARAMVNAGRPRCGLSGGSSWGTYPY